MSARLDYTIPEVEVFESSAENLIVLAFENRMLRKLLFYVIEYYFSIIFSG